MRLTERATKFLVLFLSIFASQAFAEQFEAVPGEYLVKMKSSVPADKDVAAIQSLQQQLGAHIKSVMFDQNILVIQRPSFELSDSVVSTLSQDNDVEYIEPNYIYRISQRPNDPMLGQLWGMENTQNPGVDIGAAQAWAIETGNKNLIVAVIDTGINYNHPDLKDNLWVNTAELNGQPGVDDDGNGVIDDIYGYNAINGTGNPLDDHGHGSHCSGTIGAKGNDGKGIVGVAWNVRLMGVKFLAASGGGTLEGAIKAIDYAVKMGARVLSNSWGGGGFSKALKEAIDRANAAGAVFVAAAGNEGNDNDKKPTYPATYDSPNIITVAAIDSTGRLASFSNYGKNTVHVAAPGVNILSSIKTNGYETMSGTSMATPHVSGAVALLLSKEPNLSNIEVKERLVATALQTTTLKNKVASGGMANIYRALTNAQPAPNPDDPALWQSQPYAVESEHPYQNNADLSFDVSVPGAKQISIYFEKFDTESRYDTLTIKDGSGNTVAEVSGNNDDSYSAIINGSSAILSFKSDGSINRFGFKITKVSYR